jgi:Carboxypeptidase regulatory-like domain/TonB-dependent Receptor Plug Domain/TonB dependent receptor
MKPFRWRIAIFLLGALGSGIASAQTAAAWVSGDEPVPGAKTQVTATSSAEAIEVTPLMVAAEEQTPVTTIDKVHPPQLSGTVVDPSGAAIAGATVEVRSENGTVQKSTQSNRNGSFTISGLAAGNYQLVVFNPDFETQEMPVTIGTTGPPPPLRISLAVNPVSTTINVQGREDDLIGIAGSATQGTVGAKEIQDRPILRAGEVLETVPGLIITQHAGGGKANQYFLRGFNLDHGTDFAIFVDDMPLNLPSHAHGEGYSDMNIVIPEFVKRVNFEKGPYYANVGNFGSAGSAHLEYFKTLPENFLKVEGGSYSYGRAVFGASQKLGKGDLLYGGEEYYYDGPWKHPDAYNKINGLLSYSRGDDANGVSITGRAYRGKWNSSDQIPVTAVPLVGFFGALNPADGGHSQRYSVQGEWHRQGANSESKISTYAFYYDLNLFSDFTYYLTDFQKGDQFEQQDRRWVAGLDAHHTIFSTWLGRKMANTFGVQFRNDWINNGLYRADNRGRTTKTDYYATGITFYPVGTTTGPACITTTNTTNPTITITLPNGTPTPTITTVPTTTCPTLPATTERDNFTDTIGSAYVENKIQWANKFRSVVALRGDDEQFVVTSLAYSAAVNAANSGSATKFLPSPKASLIFGPWANTEFYTQGGFSFHSNDGRGATQTVEPVSPDNPYPNTPVAKITPLVQTKGAEVGVRTVAVPHLQSTLALWYLHSNSELQQDGDTGTTVASEQSSNRYGIEWANYYAPGEHLALDFDIADSRAQFTQIDPDDAAQSIVNGNVTTSYVNGDGITIANTFPYPNGVLQGGPGGKLVPEAVKVVISSGITLHDYKGFSSSLRLRYFGPRELTSDGFYRSNQTVLLNGELGYQISRKWHVSAEFLNMLDRRDSDIDYAYTSQITPTGTPAFTRVFHPSEPFLVRFALGRTFGGNR